MNLAWKKTQIVFFVLCVCFVCDYMVSSVLLFCMLCSILGCFQGNSDARRWCRFRMFTFNGFRLVCQRFSRPILLKLVLRLRICVLFLIECVDHWRIHRISFIFFNIRPLVVYAYNLNINMNTQLYIQLEYMNPTPTLEYYEFYFQNCTEHLFFILFKTEF